jgi:putative ATP-dependent endonuclease of OLD family
MQVRNLCNFRELDVCLAGNTVLLGENRIGKSNFLFALRLVLDAGLLDSARQLKIAG